MTIRVGRPTPLRSIPLAEKDWIRCTECGGNGSYDISSNCFVVLAPCCYCEGGYIKYKRLSVEEWKNYKKG